MKRFTIVLTLLCASLGCGGESSPSAPSAIPAVPGPPPAATVGLRPLFGYVSDTAFRPVAGVNVQIVNGQHAGLVAVSDSNGRFAYDQDVASPSDVRATKDGYAIGTNTSILTSDGRAYVGFALASLSPPVAVAGSYTLTITADSTCTALADDVRTRTYQATISASSSPTVPANTRLTGTLTGGQSAPHVNQFFVGVFGDYVVISTQGEGPSIAEHVGSNRYVAFDGAASLSVPPDGISTLSAPFAGTIEYCELASPIGPYYDCGAAVGAVRHQCQSTRHQLTLARR